MSGNMTGITLTVAIGQILCLHRAFGGPTSVGPFVLAGRSAPPVGLNLPRNTQPILSGTHSHVPTSRGSGFWFSRFGFWRALGRRRKRGDFYFVIQPDQAMFVANCAPQIIQRFSEQWPRGWPPTWSPGGSLGLRNRLVAACGNRSPECARTKIVEQPLSAQPGALASGTTLTLHRYSAWSATFGI